MLALSKKEGEGAALFDAHWLTVILLGRYPSYDATPSKAICVNGAHKRDSLASVRLASVIPGMLLQAVHRRYDREQD